MEFLEFRMSRFLKMILFNQLVNRKWANSSQNGFWGFGIKAIKLINNQKVEKKLNKEMGKTLGNQNLDLQIVTTVRV